MATGETVTGLLLRMDESSSGIAGKGGGGGGGVVVHALLSMVATGFLIASIMIVGTIFSISSAAGNFVSSFFGNG